MADEPLLHNNNNNTTTATGRHNATPSHSHHRHHQQNQHGLLGQQQQQLGLVNHHHHHPPPRQDASGSNGHVSTTTNVTVGLQVPSHHRHSSLDRYASHIQQQAQLSSPPPPSAAATSTQGGRGGGSLTLSLPLHHHHRQQQQQQLAAMPAARVPPLASGSGAAAAAGKQAVAARSVSPAGIRAPGDGIASVDRPGHGRDDAWTEAATMSLIDAWGERYLQLNRGNLKQKHWREVADEVNRRAILDDSSGKACKTDVQCKNRLDTLKKKYKIEKCRLIAEGIPSKWPFFEKLDELVGPAKKGKKKAAAPSPNNVTKRLEESKVQAASNSSSSKDSAGMTDSCEHGTGNNAAADGKSLAKKRRLDGPFKDLARAIIKFGEVYERIESAKQQQLMDLERQRMEFTKDLELQRMQLFMQTQVELAKMKHANKHGNTEHYL